MKALVSSSILATWTAHLNLLDLITLTMISERYKQSRRLRWAGHVARMEEETSAFKNLINNIVWLLLFLHYILSHFFSSFSFRNSTLLALKVSMFMLAISETVTVSVDFDRFSYSLFAILALKDTLEQHRSCHYSSQWS